MALSSKTENFVNLQLFLSKSTEHIRNLFLERFKKKNNFPWNDNQKSALKFFQNDKNKASLSMMNQTQKNLALAGDTSKWDLSLFFLIFSKSNIIDKSSLKEIEKIKDVRNIIAHSSDMSLCDQEYKKYWTEIERSLINLGLNKKDIENFKLNLSKNTNETKETNEKKVQELKKEADNYFSKNNFSKSIELYSKAIDFDMPTLVDAQQSIAFSPNWFKPYARLAQIYVEFNEIPKAIENYNKALILNPSNEEVKKLLANTKYLEFEQNRYAHLDDAAQPKTSEEHFDEHIQKVNKYIGEKNTEIIRENFDKFKKMAIEDDKNLKDVFLAHEYRDGSLKCKQNYDMAAKLYGKAAKNGNAEAMFNLAQLTIKGQGVMQNFQIAISLLKNAASQPAQKKFGMNDIPVVGVAESQHLLGIIYQQGIYVSKNMAQAIEYYQMAVNNGNGRSANNLGLLFLYGDGVASDLDRAENLFSWQNFSI
ncbi:Sel1 domain repeat-containing [Brachionus plicatilis]|uniref:Sel1 domain repeat-containing n=1 Tax=Brachionus plicatilis TaxID=10195 RepID=A0A3M7QWE0_BRAPC|nr:Sel1 domain repeat-containing [Brachionus plicatilis]